MKRIVNALAKLNRGKRYAAFALYAAAAMALPAQTFTTLFTFDGTDGSFPDAALVQTANGDMYGTTASGGAYGGGTIFKITPSGALTTLYSFCAQAECTDGQEPNAGLVQATDGDLYGTTTYGGANICEVGRCGTIFKITPSGTLTTLYSFCSQSGCTDGEYPFAGLVQAANGDLYGTTFQGVGNSVGTVFKITPSRTLTTLISFDGTNGAGPMAGLIQAANGDLYGTTSEGGANCAPYGCGTVFKITQSGTLTTLVSFDGTNGAGPTAGLVQATDGDFYGTTYGGSSANYGTVFKITPSGTLTTLYSFCSQSGCPDGAYPVGGLVQATNGDFYGTTFNGANVNCNVLGDPLQSCGTVFQITAGGTLTTLHRFCAQSGCPDGDLPAAALVQNTNGILYGTTEYGTIFSLSVGLGPFVETQTPSGKVGAVVRILGTDLTGATSVTFNGTAAVFSVDASGSSISTTVPTGATTGAVEVVTPGGTLLSNVPFHVLP